MTPRIMTFRTLRLTILLLLLVGTIAAAQAPRTSYFTAGDCPFPAPDEAVRCGVLTVPENHAEPSGRTLKLLVMVLPALSEHPRAPVFYLEGGPGYSALFRANEWAQHPLRVSHDIVLYDQRGMGFSTPSLNCPEVEQGDYGQFSNPLAHCRYRIVDEEGIDISQFHSAASASDMDALRAALGYEQINLYGISYGTRLALTYMRDYPDSVRAAVLDSILPPEADFISDRITNRIQAFDRLFRACAADPACNSIYPDLETVFYDTVERLDATPYTFEEQQSYLPPTLNGGEVVDALFRGMYSTAALRYLPYGIDTLANAQTDSEYVMGYRAIRGHVTASSFDATYTPPESITDYVSVRLLMQVRGDISWSEGANASVNCAEEIAFSDENAATNADAGLVHPSLVDYLTLDVRRTMLWCSSWDVPRRPALETERVSSTAPSLLIGGAYDPITAISWMMSAGAGLPNNQTVIFSAGGHGVTYSNPCGQQILTSFLYAPHLPLDTTCATTPRLTFYEGR